MPCESRYPCPPLYTLSSLDKVSKDILSLGDLEF